MAVVKPSNNIIPWINSTGQDPAAKLDYAISLEDYLKTGETVASLAWGSYESDTASTADSPFEVHSDTSLTPQAASITEDGVTYTRCEVVWLEVEGVDATAKQARLGQTGVITLTFTTDQDRTDSRSFKLQVRQN